MDYVEFHDLRGIILCSLYLYVFKEFFKIIPATIRIKLLFECNKCFIVTHYTERVSKLTNIMYSE